MELTEEEVRLVKAYRMGAYIDVRFHWINNLPDAYKKLNSLGFDSAGYDKTILVGTHTGVINPKGFSFRKLSYGVFYKL